LLRNEALQAEAPLIYGEMTRLLRQGKQPLILVDWSNADTEKRHFILRASLALEGRPLTLHQVVVPMDEYTCPHVHRAFLYRLKQVLPADFKPVIITDAGFKVPWFKQIRKLGWHYIARVRGNQTQMFTTLRLSTWYKKHTMTWWRLITHVVLTLWTLPHKRLSTWVLLKTVA
jgi:hypothetical protein